MTHLTLTSGHRLWKGTGFHLDFLCVGLLTAAWQGSAG
jgi:hypothetical protein